MLAVTCQHDGQDQNAIHRAVVLEMDVVNDEQTWREQDRDGGSVALLLLSDRGGADVQAQGVNEHKLRDNDSCSLEVDCLPAIIAEILDFEHLRIDEARQL